VVARDLHAAIQVGDATVDVEINEGANPASGRKRRRAVRIQVEGAIGSRDGGDKGVLRHRPAIHAALMFRIGSGQICVETAR
jgi:hypothetical protein